MKKIHDAGRIDIITNFAMITSVVIKKVHCMLDKPICHFRIVGSNLSLFSSPEHEVNIEKPLNNFSSLTSASILK